MSNVNGDTCLESTNYRGFEIDLNRNKDNKSLYYSVVRLPDATYPNDYHVHIETQDIRVAKAIVNCVYAMRKHYDVSKYGRSIRNKAMKLEFRCPVKMR